MEARISARVDYLERLSRVAVLTAFAVALVSVIAALSLALSWSHRPFPGFLVEQTLVVTDTSGTNWAGPQAGIQHPQQVARIGGYAVTTKADFAAVLSAYQAGQQVSVLTRSPDGSSRLYPSITLADFPRQDLIHLFWMPYLIGLVYLGIGLWLLREHCDCLYSALRPEHDPRRFGCLDSCARFDGRRLDQPGDAFSGGMDGSQTPCMAARIAVRDSDGTCRLGPLGLEQYQPALGLHRCLERQLPV